MGGYRSERSPAQDLAGVHGARRRRRSTENRRVALYRVLPPRRGPRQLIGRNDQVPPGSVHVEQGGHVVGHEGDGVYIGDGVSVKLALTSTRQALAAALDMLGAAARKLDRSTDDPLDTEGGEGWHIIRTTDGAGHGWRDGVVESQIGGGEHAADADIVMEQVATLERGKLRDHVRLIVGG